MNEMKLWLVGCWGFTTVPVTRMIRLSEWVTPGDTAIPGMTSLKDGDLQHSSALAQSPKRNIEPKHPSEINPNSNSRSRSDGRSRRFVQYRVDQSQGQRPRSLLSPRLPRNETLIKTMQQDRMKIETNYSSRMKWKYYSKPF